MFLRALKSSPEDAFLFESILTFKNQTTSIVFPQCEKEKKNHSYYKISFLNLGA
jgi:hypothetical protein